MSSNKTRGESQNKSEPPPKRARPSVDDSSSSDEDDDIFELPDDYGVPSTNPEVIAIQQSYQEAKGDLLRRLKRIEERAVIQARLQRLQSEIQASSDQIDISRLQERYNALQDELRTPTPIRNGNNQQHSDPSLGGRTDKECGRQENNLKTLSDSEMMPPPPPKAAKTTEQDEDTNNNSDARVGENNTSTSGPSRLSSTRTLSSSGGLSKPVYIFEGREFIALSDHLHLRPTTTTTTTTHGPENSNSLSSSTRDFSENALSNLLNAGTFFEIYSPLLRLTPPPSPSVGSHPPQQQQIAHTVSSPSCVVAAPVEADLHELHDELEQLRNNRETYSHPLLPTSISDVSDEDDEDDDEEYHENEMEIASDSDFPENPIENQSSSDSPSSSGEAAPPGTTFANYIRVNQAQGDLGHGIPTTDSVDSDDNGSSDEITEEKSDSCGERVNLRECASCDSLTCFIYCRRCFKIRRNWLPARPRPANRRLKNIRRTRHSLIRTRRNRRMDADSMITDNTPRQETNPSSTGMRSPIIRLDRIDAALAAPSQSLESQSAHADLNTAFIESFEDNPSSPSSFTQTFSMLSENIRSELSNLSGVMEDAEKADSTEGGQKQENILGEALSNPGMKPPPTLNATQPKPNSAASLNLMIGCHDQNEGRDDVNISLSDTCIICCSRKKNAAFVHGKLAHFCCCYTCGDKILKRDGKCPICRERILRLVKILSS